MVMKVIEIENLEKIYNESEIKVHAIRGIDLSFEEGEFTAIVGPSGSGKTTLLNPKIIRVDQFQVNQYRIRFPGL
jgi:ABC-type lipoprotein export system ATPase subunit